MSELSGMSAMSVLILPLALAHEAGNLSVQSVQVSAKGLEVVVQSAVSGARHTFQFSRRMGQDFSQATAASVELVASASGQLLVASGKVLGIIPNEQGRALLHHSRNREPA
ncbi:hypothetical protein V8J88_03525 [Massilia sp. W12]|uniref:hypothetical protein n=1 Tax=Massilia sp. W12 TaxID=3126507 RepID=UPI0030D4D25C